MKQKKNGQKAEQMAASYLRQQGMEIIGKNYCCGQGEIDLIGREEDTLVFIEVKARTDDRCGYPGEAVDRRKQKKICQAARFYCYEKQIPEDKSIRFDVVEILGDQIRHIRHAFEYQGVR